MLVLPEPGGARDQHHAVGLQDGLLELDQRLGLEAELGHVQPQVVLVEQPHDDLLAPEGGQGADAVVERLALARQIHLEHDAAVLRQPLLADVQLGHDLDARDDGVLQLQRRGHDGLQDAVHAEAHAVFLLVGLDVNVAGGALHRVGEDQVHQLDDGRFLGGPLQFAGGKRVFIACLQLDVGIALADVRHHLFQVFLVGVAVGLVDALKNRRFRSHHRLDVEAGHELDVVHGEHVGGIHHGDGERGADPAEGQDLIAARGFRRNQLHHRGIDVEIREIDGRNAVLPGEEVGDVFVGNVAQLHQHGTQPRAIPLLLRQRAIQLFLRDDLLFDQKITEPLRHCRFPYRCRHTRQLSNRNQPSGEQPDCALLRGC